MSLAGTPKIPAEMVGILAGQVINPAGRFRRCTGRAGCLAGKVGGPAGRLKFAQEGAEVLQETSHQ